MGLGGRSNTDPKSQILVPMCETCNIKIVQNTFNEIVLSTDFVEHSSSFDLPAAFLACSEGRLGAARSQKLVIYHAFEQVHCRFI